MTQTNASTAQQTFDNGTRQIINDVDRVYYEGYWIKRYEPPADSLEVKKQLIQSLTRRLFNHMEHGINIPGRLLDEVREVYEAETDPAKKRVKGAMLAGALFNRAADIFTHLVELEASGVEIGPDNDLMHTCGLHLREAIDFGKMVKHRNGDEGIDELWGEPFKAFMMPIEEFFESRYLKIAMTMNNIDEVANYMASCATADLRLQGLDKLILDYAQAAKTKCETLRTDHDNYDVWSDFVVAGEAIAEFEPLADAERLAGTMDLLDAKQVLRNGVKLINFITRARTPMPLSTKNYMAECELYKHRND